MPQVPARTLLQAAIPLDAQSLSFSQPAGTWRSHCDGNVTNGVERDA